jgi:site-specific recombinase XerD
MGTPDLRLLLESWALHLRAERKSPQTVTSYLTGVRLFLTWCGVQQVAAVLDRATVNAFVSGLLDAGAEAATARTRQLALRRFSAWLAEEGEIPRDELVGLKPPKVDVKVTPVLTDDQLRDLIKACSGRDFRDRRDEAIVRLMFETGLRAGEVVGIGTDDLDLAAGRVTVRRGKGGKARSVPFGSQTARAIDRYVRLRRTHLLAESRPLWLGDRGKGLGYYGLHAALTYRAQLAGISGFHPHVLRHTAASRWLAAGGSEGGLMSVAGWKRRDMLDRYVAATAADRAAVEARGLNLGDL